MIRTLLCFAIVFTQLAALQEAWCRPPEEVTNSLVPPLMQPPLQTRSRAVRDESGSAGSGQQRTLMSMPMAAPATSPSIDLWPHTILPRQRSHQDTPLKADGNVGDNLEQANIWNSPDMVAARAVIVEFCRLSAQTSPEEGQKFLTQLSQLSPEQMLSWLERYHTRRKNDLLGREVEQLGRQLMVEQSLSRREAMRQAAARIAELRSQATAARAEQYPTPQQLAAARRMRYSGVVTFGAIPGYDPFDAVVDPVSPRGHCRQVAAAMSLPGDLPRDDPRNFMQGEEGADFGEWATSRDAEPPATQSAPAPATPAIEPAAGE